MSNFIQHIPCPKCGSKDNLGEWDDGFYCFGCGYRRIKGPTIEYVKKKIINKESTEIPVYLPGDFTLVLPKQAVEWLRKYKITFTEMYHFSIGWSEENKLLIFPYIPYWWVGRNFGEGDNKYETRGNTSKYPLIINKNKSNIICIVEDYVSAIKVGRVLPCMPLLKAHITMEMLVRLSKCYLNIIFWLDENKHKESFKFMLKSQQLFNKCTVISTDKDPKEYENVEVLNHMAKGMVG